MLKQILNLDGAQELGKEELKSIHGGKWACGWKADGEWAYCPDGYTCSVEHGSNITGHCIIAIDPSWP